jgi:hypothetical protein
MPCEKVQAPHPGKLPPISKVTSTSMLSATAERINNIANGAYVIPSERQRVFARANNSKLANSALAAQLGPEAEEKRDSKEISMQAAKMKRFFEVHCLYQNPFKRDTHMPFGPFQRAIVQKFGRPILTKADAVDLEGAIYAETGELVSYNTIRRFFGLAAGGEPRVSVLNIYAKYLGYESYQAFHKNLERHRFYNLWTNIILKTEWTQAEREELVTAAVEEDRFAQSVLLHVLHDIIREQPFHDWIPWLKCNSWVRNEEANGVKMFYTNTLGPVLRTRVTSHEEAQAFVSHPEIVNWAVHFFTDYSSLQEGYFMYVMTALLESTGPDIYPSGMHSMRALFVGNYEAALPHLEYIIDLGYDGSRYPVLNSRYFASIYYRHWILGSRVPEELEGQIEEAYQVVPPYMHHLLGMELFPMMALLGHGEAVIRIAKFYRAFDSERIHWTAALDLDLTRLALMISFAQTGDHSGFHDMESLIQPENWYVSYRDYQECLYAIAEIRYGRSDIRFRNTLDRFPGLKRIAVNPNILP